MVVNELNRDKSRESDAIATMGSGLKRPECVLAHQSGLIFVPSWEGTGGISIVRAGAPSIQIRGVLPSGAELKPNGIALEPGGNFLVAQLGLEHGGIYRLHSDGAVEPVLTHLNGRGIPPTNFVTLDRSGRIWFSVSTTVAPRWNDYRAEANSGFIAILDNHGARIVADGLAYANEFALSKDEKYLYVNETFGRRTSRFTIGAAGSLSERMVVAEYGRGIYPDGVALDEEAGFWITSPVSNCVLHVDSGGRHSIALHECAPNHIGQAENDFRNATFSRAYFETTPAKTLQNISSLAFGGSDLRTAYLGSLLGNGIPYFKTDATGIRMPHFDYSLGRLEDFVRTL
jgi:sugar lactone lactonase YvrE